MLERIHTKGASLKQATAPNQEECPDELKPLAYPFDLAWEKSQAEKAAAAATAPTSTTIIDNALAEGMEVLNIKKDEIILPTATAKI